MDGQICWSKQWLRFKSGTKIKRMLRWLKMTFINLFYSRMTTLAHWTYLLWIHSNYNTHCLYHFENPAIVAIKSDIFTFIHVKSIKVTSGFNLRRIKKSARGHWHAKKSKTNLKTLVSPLLIRPQGSQGCQKMRQDPLNMQQEVWCAKIAPERHKLRKTIKIGKKCQKTPVFLDFFEYSSIWGQY